jgi:hypothetical protein
MGYRSDIHSIIYSYKPGKLDALIAAAHMKGVYDKSLDELVYRTQIKAHGSTVYSALYLKAESFKWYNEFPEVQSWYSLIRLSQEEQFDLMYEFVRCGEDDTDTEYDTSDSHHSLLYVTRRIDTNFEEIEESEEANG